MSSHADGEVDLLAHFLQMAVSARLRGVVAASVGPMRIGAGGSLFGYDRAFRDRDPDGGVPAVA